MYTTTTYGTTATQMPTISPAMWIFYIAIAIFMIVVYWKIFEKAGQPGWAAIIPIYNIVVLLKILKMDWWHILIMLFVPFAAAVYGIIMNYKLALKFGKDTGFAVLTIFFSIITLPILAFGSAKYEG